jgi:cytoskeletal protein RodZ
VRNYARELGIDPVPLIDDLNTKIKLRGLDPRDPDLGPAGSVLPSTLNDRAWRHVVLAAIVLALMCAGLIGAWVARYPSRGLNDAARQAPPPAASPPSPGTSLGQPVSQSTQPASAPTAAPSNPGSADPEPAAAAASAPAASAIVATSPAPVGAATAVALAGASQPASALADDPAKVAAARIPVATLTPAIGATTGLLLRFNDRSWVEVSQPGGRILLSRNGEAGSMELVNASAPLVLVVGRADAVDVEYRGQSVNLKPYANGKGVARLMLADTRATSGGQSNR